MMSDEKLHYATLSERAICMRIALHNDFFSDYPNIQITADYAIVNGKRIWRMEHTEVEYQQMRSGPQWEYTDRELWMFLEGLATVTNHFVYLNWCKEVGVDPRDRTQPHPDSKQGNARARQGEEAE